MYKLLQSRLASPRLCAQACVRGWLGTAENPNSNLRNSGDKELSAKINGLRTEPGMTTLTVPVRCRHAWSDPCYPNWHSKYLNLTPFNFRAKNLETESWICNSCGNMM